MDSDVSSPTIENDEPKAEFRKLTNEAANRNYRRRSPTVGSSDEDGSPSRDHTSRGNPKALDYERRNGDRVDDRNSSRLGRSSDSYRHSSRGYHSRHDDYSRYGKHADEDDRSYAKSSFRSGRDRDREGNYYRSRDHNRDVDRYARDRSDVDRKYKDKDSDKTGHDGRRGSRYDDHDRHARDRDDRYEKRDHRSSRDHRSERTKSDEDFRARRTDAPSKGEMDDPKDLDGSKNSQEGKNKNDGLDRLEAKHGGDRSGFVSEDFAAKRPKLSSEENDSWKDERRTSGFKQGGELVTKVTSEQGIVNGSDSAANADAAKVAAMKAAELVNKNLVGTGFMTADQKKKLLWGSKKSNSTEESSCRWDTAMFSDRERQEKFNKLMGVKGDVKVDSRPSSGQDAEKQRELQLDLEKQYTAGLRRRDGRTVGLGL